MLRGSGATLAGPAAIAASATSDASPPPVDERAVMGRTAGLLWLLTAGIVLLGLVLPGPEEGHPAVALGLGIYGLLYGFASLFDVIPWSRAPLWQHRAAVYLVPPLAGVLLWATGGVHSWILTLLPVVMFFAAYFHPRPITVAVVALGLLSLASPLVYDPHAVDEGYLPTLATVGACSVVLAAVTAWLKGRLVSAELIQRQMALEDPLTGAANRRAFDLALQDEVARVGPAGTTMASPSALLFVDLDRFKQVNDTYGHQAGDRVLVAVAEGFAAVLRPADTLARIGGDEFAVVASRAGEVGARRLAEDLRRAAAAVAPAAGAEPISVTVGVAVLDVEHADATELMHLADRRLHDAKERRTVAVIG